MAQTSNYCKAYLAKRFREFPEWKEDASNLRKHRKKQEDGKEVEVERTAIADDDVLYLHDNYTVADGIFHDENVVFNKVTEEWKTFCQNVLEFKIPVYEPIVIKAPNKQEVAEAGA